MAKVKSANKLPGRSLVLVPEVTDKGETIFTTPCHEIFADTKWNARSVLAGDSTVVAKDSEGKTRGFAGIVCSMAIDGRNNEPVVVYANPDYKSGTPHTDAKGNPVREGRPYLLCCGFQRYAARIGIASGKQDAVLADPDKGAGLGQADIMGLHTSNPTLRAVVEVHTAASARKRNIEENTLRNNLSTPDLVAAVLDLVSKQPGISQAQLGTAINNTQPYAGKLLAIGKAIQGVKAEINGVEKPILTHWREHSVKATVAQMFALASLSSPAEKQAAFVAACGVTKGATETAGGASTNSPDKWIESGKAAMRVQGQMLGYLASLDLITVDEASDLFTEENVETLLRPIKALSKKALGDSPEAVAFRTDFAQAAHVAFDAAVASGPPAAEKAEKGESEEGEEEEEEETPVPVAAKKASAKASASQVQAAVKAATAKKASNGKGRAHA